MTRRTQQLVAFVVVLVLAGWRVDGRQQTRGTTVANGSGKIVGTVVDARAQPVRSAIVRLTGSEIPSGRAAITDDNGAFSFEGLPAGRFSLAASKPAYLGAAYGAVRPGGAGTPIALAAGQQLSDIKLTLPHGGAITGVISDTSGSPLPGVPVFVVRTDATPSLAARPEANTTDDRGVYRAFGLAPGTYFVYADPPYSGGIGEVGAMSVSEVDAMFARLRQRSPSSAGNQSASPERSPSSIVRPTRTFNTAPVFFPGVSSAAAATPITLGLAELREGVDFTYQLARSAAVAGSVTGVPAGQAVQLSLTTDGVSFQSPLSFGGGPALQRRPSTGDGEFTFTSVTPGKYTLLARTATAGPRGGPTPQAGPQLFAMATVEVSGDDISGLVLALRPTLRVTGRIVFQGVNPPPADPAGTFGVRLLPPGSTQDPSGRMILPAGAVVPPGGVPRADGTFQIDGVLPGTYRLTTLREPSGWMPKSALLGGKDLFDVSFEVTDSDVTGIEITLTDRRSQLAGKLAQPDGSPATGYFVIAFSTDRSFWQPASRRVRSVRPGTDGEFKFDDLPQGEYDLAALTDADSGEWQSATFLARILPAAIKVAIGDGERKRQDLRIGR